MKNNKLWRYVISHRAIALAYFIAVALYSIYQFYSPLNQVIGFGFMMIFPISMWIFVIPWIVAGMLCAAIAIIFWLVGVRNNILVSLLSFSASYFVISFLTTVLETSAFVEIVLGILISSVIFISVSWLMPKLTVIRLLPSIIIGAVCLGLSLYFTPTITQPIDAQRATVKVDAQFKQAVSDLNFTPYYPTYSSPVYPASPAKLNGYDRAAYGNDTVTFTLGKAEVKQGGYLKGQDKVMNFIDNCTIYRLWFSLEDKGAAIRQEDINQSLEHPQKCNLIQTTPSGKKVYFNDDGQWVRFYVQLGQTNLIIDFDNINGRKYDPSQRDEILKIIDSLQPLDKSRLEDGNSYGNGFSS